MDRRKFLPAYYYADNTNGNLTKSVGKPLRDYKVYGNSEQNGTPTPEAPVEIMSVGDKTVNLFDKNDANSVIVGYVDSTTYQAATTTKSVCIPCKPNAIYTISKNIVSSRFIVGCTANKPAQGETILVRVGASANTTATITTTADSNYLVIWIYHSNYDTADVLEEVLNTLQIEEGETETAYEPYGYKVPIKVIGKNLLNEPYKDLGTTNIYLDEPLRKAVDIADYVDFKNGKVVRALDCLTFDGTEDWRAAAEIVYMNLPKTASGDYVYEFGKNSISTHLKAGADTKTDGELYFSPVGSVLRVHKKNGTYTDVEGWKTFLAEEYAKGNPVQLITPFKTPTEEPMELPPIPTAKGITTIIVDTTTQPSE